jgi:hypothetical protein
VADSSRLAAKDEATVVIDPNHTSTDQRVDGSIDIPQRERPRAVLVLHPIIYDRPILGWLTVSADRVEQPALRERHAFTGSLRS